MDLIRASKMGIVNDRKIVKCLNHLLRMMCHLRSIAKTWTMMARGLVIWYCKQLLLLHGVTFAFIGTCHLAGYIRNFDQPGACMIHLSYHDEEHYNSVRLKEDTGDGPARPIAIKADSNLSSSSCQAKAGSNKSKLGAGKDITDAGSIKLVMAGSGCENIEKVEQTLLQMYGDVDAAIEYLIAEKGIEDFSEETVETVPSPCYVDASHVIKLLNPEKVERKRSEAREGLTHLHFLVDLMEGHLIWGLFVSDLLLKCGLSSTQESQQSCGFVIASTREWGES